MVYIALLDLKMVGFVTTFIASLIGYFLPPCLGREGREIFKSWRFRILKAFSAGIILGVALLHVFPEANASLEQLIAYPLCSALLGAGIILTLGFDQIALHALHAWPSKESDDEERKIEEATEVVCDLPPRVGQESGERSRHLRHDYKDARALSKAIIIDVSVAIHSIVLGFGFGALGKDEAATLKVLIIVLCIHQFFEGIGVGVTISDSPLSFTVVCWFGVFFSVTVPIGIVLGLTVPSSSTTGEWVAGCAGCVAAGMLLYTASIEMIAEEFLIASHYDSAMLKFSMWCAATIGVALMCVLAIWG
jgi:zinc transporter 1/2/3